MPATMSMSFARSVRLSAALATLLCAGAAIAQPTLTSLGTGTPLSVTDAQAGTYFIGGSSGNAVRWALNGGSLTQTNLTIPGSGLLSASGQYMAVSLVNLPRFASGNTATGVSPAFLAPGYAVPTLTVSTTQPAATEFGGGRYDFVSGTSQNMGVPGIIPFLPNTPANALGNSGVFGVGSGGSSTSSFVSTNAISPNGRYIVGLAYVSAYNQGSTAGTSVSSSTFYWRPVVSDLQNPGTGTMTVLPTPFRTSTSAGANTRRRTGNPYAVSNDGLVIVGAQEHNSSVAPSADPDGGRAVVWRFDPGTSTWGMTYLPNGIALTRAQATDTFTTVGPIPISSTPGSFRMNAAGTLIIGFAISDQFTTTLGTTNTLDDIVTGGTSYLAKWTWNAGTSSWDGPTSLVTTPLAAASWLPLSVTSCGVPARLSMGGMSDDGSIVVGTATYSTCGSFMAGGWIWTDPSVLPANGGTNGAVVDWYDYLVSRGVTDVTSNYGPVGDNGDPSRGLPKLGFPSAISPDGSIVVGFQGGNQLIPGAVPWALRPQATSGCVSATIISNPVASATFSRCSNPILNVAASGSLPITYQWFKDGAPVSDGTTAAGGTIVGATDRQFRLNNAKPGDAGTYYCVVTGPCGTPQTSTSTVITADPAVVNDTLATALPVGEGTFTYNLCGAYVDDTASLFPGSCTSTTTTGDVWYTYTPTFTGEARIETCGANFDTIVTVFDGTGNEVACNDDYLTGPSAGCTASRSRVARLPVTAGSPLTVRVVLKSNFAPSSFSSTGSIRFAQAPAPAAGDLCSAPIPAVSGANAFDTSEATNSGDNPSCGVAANLNTRDVWFSYTPARSGTIRVSTCPGTSFDTVLSIHQSCGGSDIACSDNVAAGVCGTGTSTQSVISGFPLIGGETYLIRVGGKALSNFGAGVMTLTYSPTPCGLSDVAGANQSVGADGLLTADDIIVFLGWFFAGDTRADVAGPNQTVGADGQYTADDIIVFLGRYFQGC